MDDLISREALLKAMEEERQYLLARGQTGAEHILVHHCLPIIDNAPIVSQVTVFCENADEKTVEELKAELKQVITELRPQGEWIDEGVNGWKCNKCGYGVERYNNTNFCPNCGARMRKGDADMQNITETSSSCTTTNPNSVEAYHQSLKGGAV